MSCFLSKRFDQCVTKSELTSSNVVFCQQPKDIQSSVTEEGKKQETGLVIFNWIHSIVDNSSVNCCSFNSHSCFEKTNKTVRDTYSKRLCKQEVREFEKYPDLNQETSTH